MVEELIAVDLNRNLYRVALLGAGGIAPDHARVLRCSPRARLVAVCDVSGERAASIAERFAIPKTFTSAAAMLDDCRPDVVHVLLPPPAHVPLALQCMKAGSHVFLEKPIGVSSLECDELRRVASASGRKVGVNHNLIYYPAVQQLIREIRAGRFGRLAHVNVVWSVGSANRAPADSFFLQAPQNVLLEWGVHPLSVIRRLLGNVRGVSSLVAGEVRTASGKCFRPIWQTSVECERGTAQMMLGVGAGFGSCRLDVLGEDAFGHLEFLQDWMILTEESPYRPVVAGFAHAWSNFRRMCSSSYGHMKDYLLAGLGRQSDAGPWDIAMRDSILSFYDALERGTAPPEGLEEGSAVIAYCEAIFRSAFPGEGPGAVQ